MKLIKSISFVSLATLTSRVFGFVRDIICAFAFGASAEFDAFLVAFRIPNFMRALFAEGAFSQAFVPSIADYSSKVEQRAFASKVLFIMMLILSVISIPFYVFSKYVVLLFAPGFALHPQQLELASRLVWYTFPYLLCISCAGIVSAVLNYQRKFVLPALMPILLNLMMIIAASLASYFGVIGLGFAVGVSGLAQLLVLWLYAGWHGCWLYPRYPRNDRKVLGVFVTMLAAIVGVSFQQLSSLFDTFVGSFLSEGSLSWLYYSQRIVYLPIGVIAVAITTVMMPQLSKYFKHNQMEEFRQLLHENISLIMMVGIPAAVALFVLADNIVVTLFFQGNFNQDDVVKTTQSLRAMVIGLPAFMLIKVMAATCFAKRNVKSPVYGFMVAFISHVIISLSLIRFGHVALAFSSAVSAYVNMGGLCFILKKDLRSFLGSKARSLIGVIVLSSISMGLLLLKIKPDYHDLILIPLKGRWASLVLDVFAGFLCWYLLSPLGPIFKYRRSMLIS
ncbi:MAG TPA: murein biosynthesis integral membrane protein MurJ [Gammaproteobacteria bacterium]|nr:murein biosynthesis integral membrane protein MurJ [Gammaproteobacteria bacterium]